MNILAKVCIQSVCVII